MKKWYVDDVFVRNGKMYDRGYNIREDGFVEWTEPIQNGETHEFPISECSHENGDPIMVDDGEALGHLSEVSAELLDIRDNYPIDGEAYAIYKGEHGRYAFVWGWEYTRVDVDELPAQDIDDGENGLSWHDTEEKARKAMQEAIDARE